MSQPDVDQELERLLQVTRAATEPDADARARVRAALAAGLAGAGAARPGVTTRVGLGAKLWLISAFGVALVLGFGLLTRPAELPPDIVVGPASTSAAPAVTANLPPAGISPPVAVSPVVAEPSASSAGATRPSPPPSTRSASKVTEPADELALVSSMQLALRSGNASQALALANEHARRFPGGALVQEREGARAIARCQLAEPAARPAILAQFEQRYAGSPYAARVRDACTR